MEHVIRFLFKTFQWILGITSPSTGKRVSPFSSKPNNIWSDLRTYR